MENLNIVVLSGRVSNFTATVNDESKTGSFYLEWDFPSTPGSNQSVDRIFCMVRDESVDVIQNAVDIGAQVVLQGRIRTRILRHEGKNKKPVHAAYIAVKSALCATDGPGSAQEI